MTVAAPTRSPGVAQQPRGRSQGKERLVVVDAVRALALLGVLIMNLHSMSGLEFLPEAALAAVQGPVDRAVYAVLLVLVDDKALSAFSFLFGLSFTLLLQGATLDRGFILMYARRLIVLAAFGLINVLFLYWADILITYAALGALLILAVRLPQWAVLSASALLLLGVPVGLAALGAERPSHLPSEADLEALAAFRSSSWILAVEQDFLRFFTAVGRESMVGNWDLTNIFGLFLLGLWTGRRGIPHDLAGHRRLLWRVAAVALPVGLAASLTEVVLPYSSPLATLMLFGKPVLAIGYLAAAALLLATAAARPLALVLASKGRLALTNYLAYGLVGQVVFYGWAFGLIGPAEWMWRSLTKLSLVPFRR